MNRRLMTILLPVAAASLAAGCANVSDASVVARVGDAELAEDELEVYRQLIGGTDADLGDADSARSAISIWSEIQVLTQLVDDNGLEADAATIDAATQGANQSVPGFAALDDSTRDLLVDYFIAIDSLPQLTAPEDELAAWFDAGAETTGLACVRQIIVQTESEAAAIVVELDDGADFATVAVERSADPTTGPNGGFVACASIQEFADQLGPDFTLAVGEAEPGSVVGPIESGGGFAVLRIGTFDEHLNELAPIVAQGYFAAQMAIADADIEVASRYGTNDGVNVFPLG